MKQKLLLFLVLLFLLGNAFGQTPVITSFTPFSGAVGSVVTITGSSFNTTASSNVVYFGAIQANVISASTTQLVVTVPFGATYQYISVLANGLIAYSNQPFVVTFSGGGTIDEASFLAKNDFSTGSNPQSAVAADFDGDGKLDLAITNSAAASTSISVLRNATTTGNPINYSPNTISTGTFPYAIAVGDIDGDGKLDIAVANNSSSSTSVLTNTSVSSSISFNKKDITLGSKPYAIAISDIDGDGKNDIISANYNTTSTTVLFSVLLNTGSLNFTRIDFSIITGVFLPSGITIGDFDGDGKSDVAIAVSNGKISTFRNTSSTGSVSFATKNDLTAGTTPSYVASGDLDGDGKLDLAVTNSGSATVSLFKNTGSPGSLTFLSKSDFTVGTLPKSIAITDVDGDGKIDLTIANSNSNTLSVLKNSSSTSVFNFLSKVDFSATAAPSSVVLADFDNDGKPDMAATNYSSTGTVSIFSNVVGGVVAMPTIASFTPTSASAGATVTITGTNFTGTTAVSFGGVDATSFSVVSATTITAVVGSGATGDVRLVNPSGSATLAGFTYLAPPTINSFSPISGAINSQVTITGTNFNTTPTNNIVFFGATQATVVSASATQLVVTVPIGATYQYVTVVSNGFIAYSKVPFTVVAPIKLDANTFSSNVAVNKGTIPYVVTNGDIDGDGKADLITLNSNSSSFTILRNTGSVGSPKFLFVGNYSSGPYPVSVAFGDLDGDGKGDIAILNTTKDGSNGSVSIFLNNSQVGSINLTSQSSLPAGAYSSAIAIGDFSGDGKSDLAVTNVGTTLPSLYVYRNTSTLASITFASSISFTPSLGPSFISVGDLDNDNKVDIAVSNAISNSISVFRNTSTTSLVSFATKKDFTIGKTPKSSALGDLDGDGSLDIVAINGGDSTVSILKNTSTTGSLSFSDNASFKLGTAPVWVALTDFDGDTKADLAIANLASNSISVLLNKSSSNAMSLASGIDYTTGNGPSSLTIGDLDGDGKSDLAVSSSLSASISVMINNGKLPQSISLTGLSTKTYGDPSFSLTATATSGLTVTYSSSNQAVASISGSTVTIVGAGNAQITASQPGDATYAAATAVVQTLTVNKATPIITWSSPSDISYGTLLSETQLNASANVEGVYSYSPAIGTILNAGSNQSLKVSFVPSDTTNYQSVSSQVFINVTKVTPTITWSAPNDIIYGAALGGAQLNAVSNVDGSFTYSPAKETVLNAGVSQLTSIFTPTDSANYNITIAIVSINVSKATPTVSWSNPSDIIFGTALSDTQLNASADIDGIFSYTPTIGTKLNASSNQSLVAVFFPTDSLNYTSIKAQVSINVAKATPIIWWSNPSDIAYGTALSNTQLNALANTEGSFSYSPSISTLLQVDANQILSAIFTPFDSINWNNATANVFINVNKASQQISFSALNDKVLGDQDFVLTGTSSANLLITYSANPSDKVTITDNKVKLVKAGRVTIAASQNGNANYSSATAVSQSFCIKPVKPAITLSNGNTETPVLTSNSVTGNQWYLNGNAISGATKSTINATTAGKYTVQVSEDDCKSEFSTEQIVVVTGDIHSEADLLAEVFPNPAVDWLEIKMEDTGVLKKLQLLDLSGRELDSFSTTDSVARFYIANYSVGLYFIRLQLGNTSSVVRFEKK